MSNLAVVVKPVILAKGNPLHTVECRFSKSKAQWVGTKRTIFNQAGFWIKCMR